MGMKVSKAIELLTIELSAWPHKGSDDWYASVELGIEALKEAQRWRAGQPLHLPNLLPGETPEEDKEHE